MAANNLPPIPQDKIGEVQSWRDWFRNLGTYIQQAQGGTVFASSGANSDITSLSGLTTPLPISEGGTGATTAAQARINLGGFGSVSSVGISSTPTAGLTITGSPITDSGVINITTTDGFPLVTQADPASQAGHLATFNNAGGTQVADCGIAVSSLPLAVKPPTGMTNGTVSFPWNTTYSNAYNLSQYNSIYASGNSIHFSVSGTGANDVLVLNTGDATIAGNYPLNLNGNLNWNSYPIPKPTGDTTKFLSNAGTWLVPSGGTGSGTVTSVGVGVGTTRLTVSGSPVTTSGTITLGTTDGYPLVTQVYSGSVAGHIATFNNSGGTQISDCGIGVTASPLAIVPPSTMSLGTSTQKWGDFYLTGSTNWNGYAISAPSGSTTTYLRNDGTWVNPTASFLSSSNTFTAANNSFTNTGGVYIGGPTATTSMQIGFNGGAVNYYNSTVASNVNTSMYFQATSTALAAQSFVFSYNNPTGNVATPAYYFYGDGTAQKTGGGSWSSISDNRLKSNITPLTGALDKITALNPVSYSWNIETTEPTVGFIAQEVQNILPNAVKTHSPSKAEVEFIDDETLSIGWQNDMTAYLVGSIKELKAEIDSLKLQLVNK